MPIFLLAVTPVSVPSAAPNSAASTLEIPANGPDAAVASRAPERDSPTPESEGQTPATAGIQPKSEWALYFDHIVIIIMENKAICDILTSCGGSAPYMTSLANQSGLATNYQQCAEPSLPNYLCLTGGSEFGCTGYDGNPNSNNCTGVAWGSPNIVDRLESANLTWKAYMGDMPGNCHGSNSGLYAVRHNPFVYYGDIVTNPTRCSRVVPAGTNDSTFLSDLNSIANASNYMWLTPNNCNNMHSCNVTVGDTYLAGLVPQVLNSTLFRTSRAALLVMFDEASGGRGAPNLYTVWTGPTIQGDWVSSRAYNHFSLLRTVEANWNLTPLTGNDSEAQDMSEFFIPRSVARFVYSPSWPQGNAMIAFNASASSASDTNATLSFQWDWTNDGTWDTNASSDPTTEHAYEVGGVYVVRLQVNDSLGSVDNATLVVTVDDQAPVTNLVASGRQDVSGWYTTAVTMTLTATDDRALESTNYRVDEGTWQRYRNPFAIGGDGIHFIEWQSIDRAGNMEAIQSFPFRIDAHAPSTEASFEGTLGNNAWYVSDVSVTLTATDPWSGVVSTIYRVDAGTWTDYFGPFSIAGGGSHILEFASNDAAGNLEVVKTASCNIDRSNPYFTFLSVPSNVLTGSVLVSWSAADNDSSIAGYAIRVDANPFQPLGNVPSVTLNLSVGTHVIQVKATDAAGHDAINTVSIRVVSTRTAIAAVEAIPLSSIVIVLVAISAASTTIAWLWRNRRRRKPKAS